MSVHITCETCDHCVERLVGIGGNTQYYCRYRLCRIEDVEDHCGAWTQTVEMR